MAARSWCEVITAFHPKQRAPKDSDEAGLIQVHTWGCQSSRWRHGARLGHGPSPIIGVCLELLEVRVPVDPVDPATIRALHQPPFTVLLTQFVLDRGGEGLHLIAGAGPSSVSPKGWPRGRGLGSRDAEAGPDMKGVDLR